MKVRLTGGFGLARSRASWADAWFGVMRARVDESMSVSARDAAMDAKDAKDAVTVEAIPVLFDAFMGMVLRLFLLLLLFLLYNT
ncbi:MAG: hypothetical protein ACO363_02810 [Balneolaceae bacterium]